MNLQIENRGTVVLVQVREPHIGADVADEFRRRVQAALAAESPQLALDLGTVDFMDSSGLGVLVSLLKAVRPSGELVLFGLRPSVAEILRLTHLDAVFQCAHDQEAALARFSTGTSVT
jgi:anti-sigma B factor antagonist